ncbi:hypothetical protein Csa_023528, partial [Cucumis sativus]
VLFLLLLSSLGEAPILSWLPRSSPPPPSSHSPAPIPAPDKVSPIHSIWKENRPQSVSVLMPGDEVPRFIAMACPALVEIVVQKPSQSISDNP